MRNLNQGRVGQSGRDGAGVGLIPLDPGHYSGS